MRSLALALVALAVTAAPAPARQVAPRDTDSQELDVPLHSHPLSGVCFSPFVLPGQDPNQGSVVDETQVRRLLVQIAPYTRSIRTFGVQGGLASAGRIAHELGLGAAVGAWLGTDPQANALEVDALIELANRGEADLAIVGSEVLLRGDLSQAELLEHVARVRRSIPAHVPVTTAEIYSIYLARPALVDAVDVLFVNTYPYWEHVGIDDAVAFVDCKHRQLVEVAGGKPVILSETGWPRAGDTLGAAVPTPANAVAYLTELTSWARELDVESYWFAAFDEPWKAAYEGPQGAHWGLLTSTGQPKRGVLEVVNGATVDGDWLAGAIPGGPGTPAIELTSIPVKGTGDELAGRVLHVDPVAHSVAVYIRVGGLWWTKPTAAEPLTALECDGTWVADVTTGGSDPLATEVAAFLLPDGVVPPLLLGAGALPPALFAVALASIVAPKPC